MTKKVPNLKIWDWGQSNKLDDKIFDFEVVRNVSDDLLLDFAVVSEDGNLYLFLGCFALIDLYRKYKKTLGH